jgi:hypothetical protein
MTWRTGIIRRAMSRRRSSSDNTSDFCASELVTMS